MMHINTNVISLACSQNHWDHNGRYEQRIHKSHNAWVCPPHFPSHSYQCPSVKCLSNANSRRQNHCAHTSTIQVVLTEIPHRLLYIKCIIHSPRLTCPKQSDHNQSPLSPSDAQILVNDCNPYTTVHGSPLSYPQSWQFRTSWIANPRYMMLHTNVGPAGFR